VYPSALRDAYGTLIPEKQCLYTSGLGSISLGRKGKRCSQPGTGVEATLAEPAVPPVSHGGQPEPLSGRVF
jgi:hypothetical protein